MELTTESIKKYIDHPTPLLTAKRNTSCYCSASGEGAGLKRLKFMEA